MKKTLAMLLALVMVLALGACGGSSAPAAPSTDNNASPAENSSTAAPNESAQEPFTFTMGIDAEYPPFSYMDDNGNYAGFDVEICRAACEKLGWNFEVFGVNWDEKLIQLDADECDCVWSGMSVLDSMKESGYVISEPYYDNTQVMLVKADSGFTCAADLAGYDVAVQLGTSGEALLQGDLADMAATFNNVLTCDSFLKCFTELDGGAVDAVFVDLPVAVAYAAEHDGFTVLNENLGAEQYGIAFRSGDQALCDAIEGAVAELVADGTYAASAENYPDIVNNLLVLN